jgi:hypothetical protein
MIEYLNANQGFVMAILTAVYVVATIILVAVTQRQAGLTHQSLLLAAEAEKAKYRPYLVFDIVYENLVAYARIRNTGVSVARNVKISVSPQLKWNDREAGIGFIEKGLAYLAPGREISQPFGWTKEFFNQYPDLNFSGKVVFEASDGTIFEESFAIDLGYLKGTTYISKIDTAKELEGIRKTLEKFHTASFKPLIRTIDEDIYQQQELARYAEGRKLLEELDKNTDRRDQGSE